MMALHDHRLRTIVDYDDCELRRSWIPTIGDCDDRGLRFCTMAEFSGFSGGISIKYDHTFKIVQTYQVPPM